MVTFSDVAPGVQPKAKAMLYDIWMAETQPAADRAFDLFLATLAAKFPAATTCLAKDRDVLLTFYAFPAEHWIHIRTTNPVESTFATVRLRTKKTKGAGSRVACLTMVYKLAMAAQKHWRALNRLEGGEGLVVLRTVVGALETLPPHRLLTLGRQGAATRRFPGVSVSRETGLSEFPFALDSLQGGTVLEAGRVP